MARNSLEVHDHSSTGNGGGNIDPDTIAGGGVLSEGDGVDRRVWVIENGASDPADAEPQDIIIEKEP